jgi:hypothetical protein
MILGPFSPYREPRRHQKPWFRWFESRSAGSFPSNDVFGLEELSLDCFESVTAQGLSGYFAWNSEVSSNTEIVQFSQDSLPFSSHIDACWAARVHDGIGTGTLRRSSPLFQSLLYL